MPPLRFGNGLDNAMTLHEHYEQLCRLQDRVLSAVFADEVGFYLTGGTCLHRFYFDARYSDDLDLFTSDSETFRDEVRMILERVRTASITAQTTVDTRDFVRILVDESLQVDFVNDRVYRVGAPQITQSPLPVRIDNLENIAANKICAILGRDEPKDVFDFCTILQSGNVTPATMLAGAQQKCVFDPEQLETRLRSFPVALLDSLAVKDQPFARRLQTEYPAIIEIFLQGA
jgi:predicted nucleotidyltransferase component of viral defense system